MADLNKNEAERKRVADLLLDGKLTAPKDIDFFLEQFKKGEFALDDDGIMKAAELVKKSEKDVSKVSGWNKFRTYGMRNRKAGKIKEEADKIVKLESKREFDLVANKLKFDGMPLDDAGKAELKAQQDKVRENIADLEARISKKGWHPFLKAQKRKEQKNLEKIDPVAKKDRLLNDNFVAAKKQVLASGAISWYYRLQQKLNKRSIQKLNPNDKLQRKADKKAEKIKKLENVVAGTGFWNEWGSKIKLGFARRKYNKLQSKMIGNKPINDLKEQQAKLEAEIKALENVKVLTKTDKKRKEKDMALKLKSKAAIDKRLEKLGVKKDAKADKIEAKFVKKEDKAMAVIMQKTQGIDNKNEKLNAMTIEGKVRNMLLSQVSPEKRKELEAIINANTEKAITDDNDFKKFLEKAGFKEEEIKKLQDRIDAYEEKKEKTNSKDDDKTKDDDKVVTPAVQKVADDKIVVGEENEMATANELKAVIKNEKITEVRAEYKARVTLAAATSEGVTVVNTETISSLKEQGASDETVAALEKAKEDSMNKKASEMTADRSKELRELSLASKVMKMSDEEYKAFKDSGELAKNASSGLAMDEKDLASRGLTKEDVAKATDARIKLMDNVRLGDKSLEYQSLSKEEKEKVDKTKEGVKKLDDNQERKKILEARGMVTSVKPNATNKTLLKERQASQAVIKQNQANRQFR